MQIKFQEKLIEWQKLAGQLTDIKKREIVLRKEIFGEAFVEPKEGTNKFNLANDYVLKGTHKLNRKVLEDKVPDVRKALPSLAKKLKALIKYKPELVKGEYNKLNDDERKVFDRCLEIKPSTPALEIVLPKRR